MANITNLTLFKKLKFIKLIKFLSLNSHVCVFNNANNMFELIKNYKKKNGLKNLNIMLIKASIFIKLVKNLNYKFLLFDSIDTFAGSVFLVGCENFYQYNKFLLSSFFQLYKIYLLFMVDNKTIIKYNNSIIPSVDNNCVKFLINDWSNFKKVLCINILVKKKKFQVFHLNSLLLERKLLLI